MKLRKDNYKAGHPPPPVIYFENIYVTPNFSHSHLHLAPQAQLPVTHGGYFEVRNPASSYLVGVPPSEMLLSSSWSSNSSAHLLGPHSSRSEGWKWGGESMPFPWEEVS